MTSARKPIHVEGRFVIRDKNIAGEIVTKVFLRTSECTRSTIARLVTAYVGLGPCHTQETLRVVLYKIADLAFVGDVVGDARDFAGFLRCGPNGPERADY
jgi:hypothetical protein